MPLKEKRQELWRGKPKTKGKIKISMDDKEEIKKVMDAFFANASENDLRELEEVLASHQRKMQQNTQKKKSGNTPLGMMNVNNIASRFASDLRNRMGLTTEQITRTARDAVRTMILQYDPYIPEEKIDALLNAWVPNKNKERQSIPDDAMRTMISQYTAYGRGELTEAQLTAFPKDWAKKYWSFFPEKIQILIRAYIKDEITRSTFSEVLEKLLAK
jgi:hypothetical protein